MKQRVATIGGMVAALTAAACCLGPALFLAFGITGLGFLSIFEPLRPYMLAMTFGLGVVAFHYSYGKGSSCSSESGGSCNIRTRGHGAQQTRSVRPAIHTKRINRVLFWVLVGFALFGLGFPYAAAWLLA